MSTEAFSPPAFVSWFIFAATREVSDSLKDAKAHGKVDHSPPNVGKKSRTRFAATQARLSFLDVRDVNTLKQQWPVEGETFQAKDRRHVKSPFPLYCRNSRWDIYIYLCVRQPRDSRNRTRPEGNWEERAHNWEKFLIASIITSRRMIGRPWRSLVFLEENLKEYPLYAALAVISVLINYLTPFSLVTHFSSNMSYDDLNDSSAF